ncbi:MAG: hypothetical protein RIC95_08665 [Vicingaceae bacterium]
MKQILITLILSLFIGFSMELKAQPPDPVGGQGEPPTIPIDGGLSLLLAAGVAYGGKKVHDMRKKDSEDTDA